MLLIFFLTLTIQQNGLIKVVQGCFWGCDKLNDHQMWVYSQGCADDPNKDNATVGRQYFIKTTNPSNRSMVNKQCRGSTTFRFYRVECVKNYTEHDYLIETAELAYYNDNKNDNNSSQIEIYPYYKYTITEPELELCLNHSVYNLKTSFPAEKNDKHGGGVTLFLSWQTLRWDKITFASKTLISVNGRDIQTLEPGHTQFRIRRLARCQRKPSLVCVRLESRFAKITSFLGKRSTELAKECVTVTTPCVSKPETPTSKSHEIVIIVVLAVIFVIAIATLAYYIYRQSGRNRQGQTGQENNSAAHNTNAVDENELVGRRKETRDETSECYKLMLPDGYRAIDRQYSTVNVVNGGNSRY